jgi:phosphonate transport system substrate-binding protein
LWTSPIYPDLCIMAHKRLPADQVAAVKAALVGMDKDPEGRKVLANAGALVKAAEALGFVASDDHEYDGYRQFYKTTLIKRK